VYTCQTTTAIKGMHLLELLSELPHLIAPIPDLRETTMFSSVPEE
jgi:hypothetical protein